MLDARVGDLDVIRPGKNPARLFLQFFCNYWPCQPNAATM
jgi:hypothetical protein